VKLPALTGRRIEALWESAYRDVQTALLDLLPRNPQAQLLDVGSHDGAWTSEVARRVGIPPRQVAGIETIPEYIEKSEARGFEIRPGDLEGTWPFDDDRFDIVHANQVIEHVKRLDHFMQEAARVLKPGGLLVVCTENLSSWPNVGALALGYMPFSLTNISARGAVGNPFALHPDAHDAPGDTWQHVHVVTMAGLDHLFALHGFVDRHAFAAGYFPFGGSLGRRLALRDPRHAHFIGVAGRTAAS